MNDGLTGKTGGILKKVPFWGWLILVFLLGFLLRGGGGDSAHKHGATVAPAESAATAQVWTCAMHPQVRQPGPGKCPICAMDLIPATDSGADDGLEPRQLRLSESARELAGIVTSSVQIRRTARTLRLPGKVAVAETGVEHVTAWASGRVDKLYVDYTGMTVSRGQKLAQLYSPELFSAQEELLQALATRDKFQASTLASVRDGAAATADAARRKLELLGMSKGQIDNLIAAGEPSTHVDIFSPISGTITEKNVNTGMYVNTGAALYEVSNLRTVWVELDAYEQDLPWLAVGQELSFTTPSTPGESFSGRIEFIDPVLNQASRTAMVRVSAANQSGRLKPGMLATATVDSRSLAVIADEQALMVPASAPLVTGRRAVVYVAVPGKQGVFEGREVELGPRAGDYYIVRRGLSEGEQVVTNGAFKIDAAMQIAAKPSMMNPDEEQPASIAGMHDHAAMSTGQHTAVKPAAGPAGEVPERFAAGLTGLYAAYFPLQSALAADDYEKAVQAADNIGKALAAVNMSVLSVESHEKWMPFQRDLSRARESISSAGDIAEARAGFDRLSASLIGAVRAFGGHGPDSLLLFHCPMAFDNRVAEWLQSHSDPHNPYYGAMMLKCKDRVETLYTAAGKDTGER